MRIAAAIALYCILCLLMGCMRRPVGGVDYVIPQSCNPSVKLLHCDLASPPHCKAISAVYPKHCEQLVVAEQVTK